MQFPVTAFRWITASVGARVVMSISGLMLALMAAPDAFGIYGRVVLSVLTTGVFLFLRLERAVIASEAQDEAVAATTAALRVAFVTLPICLLAIWFAIPDLSRMGQPLLIVAAVAASLVAKSLLLLAFAWLQRLAQGMTLAAAMTVQAAVQLGFQALLLATPIQPVAAMLIGDSLGATAALLIALRSLRTGNLWTPARHSWRATLRSNWRLPTLNMPATLASQAATVLPLFAVAAHASAAETGAVAFAQRVLEPAFHLCAALTTQYAVEQRLYSREISASHDRMRWAALLLGVGICVSLVLTTAVVIGSRLPLPQKLTAALDQGLPVIALALAVFASGPIMDMAQLAGQELLVLIVNATTLLAGLAILTAGGGTASILWMFAALFAIRATAMLALWITDRA